VVGVQTQNFCNYSPIRISSLKAKAKAKAKAERGKFISASALSLSLESHKLLPVSSYKI
jgi:hypothetical protein